MNKLLKTFIILLLICSAGLAQAAAPTVVSSENAITGTASTNHSVGWGSTVSAGDLLVIIVTAFVTIPDLPAGWTSLIASAVNNAGVLVAYKVSDGTESTGITVTTSASRESSQSGYVITGQRSGSFISASSLTDNGSTANPDPPALSPGVGTVDTLWIALANQADGTAGQGTATGGPSGYTGLIGARSSAGDIAASLGTASTTSTAASEDPGTFTFSATKSSSSATIGIVGPSANFSSWMFSDF